MRGNWGATMTSDRQRALIERLLSEAEDAVVAGQWDVVARHAQSVLALEPSNPDGLALTAAAERMGAAIATEVPPRAELQTLPTINPHETDPEMRLQLAEALNGRAEMHRQQDDLDAAIADYTSLIETYSDDTDPKMRWIVAKALCARGRVYDQHTYDRAAAIGDYSSVIETYSDDTDPKMREVVAIARERRGH